MRYLSFISLLIRIVLASIVFALPLFTALILWPFLGYSRVFGLLVAIDKGIASLIWLSFERTISGKAAEGAYNKKSGYTLLANMIDKIMGEGHSYREWKNETSK